MNVPDKNQLIRKVATSWMYEHRDTPLNLSKNIQERAVQLTYIKGRRTIGSLNVPPAQINKLKNAGLLFLDEIRYKTKWELSEIWLTMDAIKDLESIICAYDPYFPGFDK